MTLLAFDHMIVAVDDTPRAAESFARLGFDVTHRPDAGESETDIRLICFDDRSYLEIFAFRDPAAPSKHRWKPLMVNGEGWVDYSVHCDDADAQAAYLKARNIPVSAPRTGGKSLRDGRQWQVRVAEAGFGVGSSTMPFFLQDLTPRDVRVPRPENAPQQPGGAGSAIVGVSLVTEDFARTRDGLIAAFGSCSSALNRVAGAASTHLFHFAGCWVEVFEVGKGPSELADYLKVRGEGVYEVAIGKKNSTKPGDGEVLDLQMTCSARLRVDR